MDRGRWQLERARTRRDRIGPARLGRCTLVLLAVVATAGASLSPAEARQESNGQRTWSGEATIVELPEVGSWPRLFVDHLGRTVFAHDIAPGTIELRRYVDGIADPSFGMGGVATFSGGYTDVTLLDDGSLVLHDFVDQRSRLRRVTPAGIVDPNYGGDGELLSEGYLGSVGSDGSAYETEHSERYGVRRYDPSGSLDPTYGGDGFAEVPCCDPPPGAPDFGVTVLDDGALLFQGSDGDEQQVHVLGPDGGAVGSIVADERLGHAFRGPDGMVHLIDDQLEETRVRRYLPDLSLDTEFGTQGEIILPGRFAGDGAHGTARSTAADGRFYVMTRDPTGFSVGASLLVHAFTDQGLDRSFGDGGVVTIPADPRPGERTWLTTGLATLADGGLAVTWTALVGPVGSPVDQVARLVQLSPSGDVVWASSGWRIDDPIPVAGQRSIVALTVEPPSPTLTTRFNRVRRFDLADPDVAPFTGVEAFADHVVGSLTGRAPTAAEVAAYREAIGSGTAPSTLVRLQAAQQPWGPNLEPVARLFRAYFGRPPDPSGLRFWMARRQAGWSVARISAVFADSSEFRRTYGSLTASAFVDLVYRNVLDRPADPSGAAFWTSRVERRTISRGQLMASFSESSEHVRRRSSEVATVSLTFGLLGRLPTPAELTVWAGPAPIGGPDDLVAALLASRELAVRVGRG